MKTLTGAPSAIAGETVFLAEGWILYVGIPGDFVRSEMLGPSILLSPSNEPFRIVPDGADPVVAEAILHPAGLWSSGSGSGVAILYLDPISRSGQAVHRQCASAQGCLPLHRQPSPLASIQGLRSTTPDGARAFVDHWRRALDDTLPVQSEPDHRLQRVARELAMRPEGRLNVAALCKASGLGADYLRQRFREVAGMTLSRYQMWHRLHAAIGCACEDITARQRVSAASALHGAGFHDVSHGSRAVRRYFGMPSVSASGRVIRFVDCRRPS